MQGLKAPGVVHKMGEGRPPQSDFPLPAQAQVQTSAPPSLRGIHPGHECPPQAPHAILGGSPAGGVTPHLPHTGLLVSEHPHTFSLVDWAPPPSIPPIPAPTPFQGAWPTCLHRNLYAQQHTANS